MHIGFGGAGVVLGEPRKRWHPESSCVLTPSVLELRGQSRGLPSAGAWEQRVILRQGTGIDVEFGSP